MPTGSKPQSRLWFLGNTPEEILECSTRLHDSIKKARDFLNYVEAKANIVIHSCPALRDGEEWFFKASDILSKDRTEAIYNSFLSWLDIEGDIAEFGCADAQTVSELALYLKARNIPKCCYLFDSFQGIPKLGPHDGTKNLDAEGWHATDRGAVAIRMGDTDYKIYEGFFDCFFDFSKKLSFVHIDADLYQSTMDAIKIASTCLVPGGLMIFDDYATTDWPGVKKAVEESLDPTKWDLIPSFLTYQFFAVKHKW